jgi:hypothetical protein
MSSKTKFKNLVLLRSISQGRTSRCTSIHADERIIQTFVNMRCPSEYWGETMWALEFLETTPLKLITA